MKQVLVITLLGFFSFQGNAQTLKKTKELVISKTWDKAKESIDLTIANPSCIFFSKFSKRMSTNKKLQ